MRKTIFTEQELTEKGFNKVVEGGFVNFEYVFNPEDYLNSKFLATDDISKEEYDLYEELGTKGWRVINSVNPDNGEAYLTEEEIDDLIKNGI